MTMRHILLLLCLLLLGCGGAAETAVSTPTPAPSATVPAAAPTAVPATANRVATAAPPATGTAVPPTASPTHTATPQPTATIAGLIGPDFAENVNPLTGETVRDPAVLQRRPLAVKISNAPAFVRPQAGLGSADLVFEHLSEGGYTRLTAVFYSRDADPVGSIRSGRLIDLEIPQMYDAAFAYSGSAGPVRLMFRDSAFFERIISPDFAHGGFYRIEDSDLPFIHTLITSTPTLRFLLDQRGQERPPQLANGMTFRAEPIAPGAPATRIELWYPSTNATWFYDAGSGRYLRWSDGEAHLDANTGAQLSFKNVVVVAAHHQETDIIEDTAGNPSLQIQIWGEGPVSIFRDGQRFDGRWRRSDPSHMLTFVDENGCPLPLAPGNSFFQLVPIGFDRLTVTP